jgi:inorganic pyrophosphatase
VSLRSGVIYPDMIYPCDYGYLPGTVAADGDGIDVLVGPVQTGLVGLIALIHRGDPGPDLRLIWREPTR